MQVKQIVASSQGSFSPALIAASSMAVIMALCISVVLGFVKMSSTLQVTAVAMTLMLMIFGVFFSVTELMKLGKSSR